ncbi:MAG: flagellar hook basal-body protein [Tepidisphaeraceae bacterium]
MIYGLYLSATGVITNSHQQDVIANNLANAETGGFRRQLALTETRQVESRVRQAMGLKDPIRDNIGGGQFLAPSYYDQSQGILETSSNNLDVAFQGTGFIGVQDGQGQFRLTRNGSLMTDKDGFLRTSAGQFVLSDQKQPIKLDLTGRKQVDLNIDNDGNIKIQGEDTALAKIGLFEPTDPNTIKAAGGNTFAPTEGSQLVAAKGRLLSGMTEGSNVEPATELTRLMETQRLLEANANFIRTQDQTLGRAVTDVGKIG